LFGPVKGTPEVRKYFVRADLQDVDARSLTA
jgi:hypothetical protein